MVIRFNLAINPDIRIRENPFVIAISEGEYTGDTDLIIDPPWAGVHRCTVKVSDELADRIADIVRSNSDVSDIRISR